MHYRIGKFSSMSGVPTKTLRFYDEIGLLRPASVDSRTGYRQYSSRQLDDVASILALKNLGVTLADIRQLLGGTASVQTRRDLLREVKRRIEQSMETALQALQSVNAALEELNSSGSTIPIVVKRLPPMQVASIRAKVGSYTEVVNIERELVNSLPEQSLGEVRGVLWHRCADSGGLECEPFIMLKHRVAVRGCYDLKLFSATTAACAYSASDDSSAEQRYKALKRWIDVRGYRLAGAKREVSVGEMLEIQFPFQSA